MAICLASAMVTKLRSRPDLLITSMLGPLGGHGLRPVSFFFFDPPEALADGEGYRAFFLLPDAFMRLRRMLC